MEVPVSLSIITVGVNISEAPSGTYTKVREILNQHDAEFVYEKPMFGFNPHAILTPQGTVDNDKGASLVVTLHGLDGVKMVYDTNALRAHFGDLAAAPAAGSAPVAEAPAEIAAAPAEVSVPVSTVESDAEDNTLAEFIVVAEDGEESPLLLAAFGFEPEVEPEPEPEFEPEVIATEHTLRAVGSLTVPWRGNVEARTASGTLIKRRIATTHTTDGSGSVFVYLDKPFRPLGIFANVHAARTALLVAFPAP